VARVGCGRGGRGAGAGVFLCVGPSNTVYLDACSSAAGDVCASWGCVRKLQVWVALGFSSLQD
jgi:hypothetical protein